MIIARSQYDVRPVLESDVSFEGDKGLTKQADAKDCDINLLMKRFERTGTLPDMIVRDGHYGDYSDVPTLQEAFAIAAHAQEQFDNLDAPIRNRFDNDPLKFAAFATDPKNLGEMEKLGLLNDKAIARLQAERDDEAKKAGEARDLANSQAFDALVAKVRTAIAGK